MSASNEEQRVYHLYVSDTADIEADSIFLWIGQQSEQRAERWYRELYKIFDRLLLFPYSGEALPHRPEVRRVLHGSYRILYRVVEPEGEDDPRIVRILRIIHGARQTEEAKPDE